MVDTVGEDQVELTPKIMVLLVNEDEAKTCYRRPAGVHAVIVGRNGEYVNDFYIGNFLEKRLLPRKDGTVPPNER